MRKNLVSFSFVKKRKIAPYAFLKLYRYSATITRLYFLNSILPFIPRVPLRTAHKEKRSHKSATSISHLLFLIKFCILNSALIKHIPGLIFPRVSSHPLFPELHSSRDKVLFRMLQNPLTQNNHIKIPLYFYLRFPFP